MAEVDPLECSLMTLDLGNEDLTETGEAKGGTSVAKTEKMPSRDKAWDGAEEAEARKAKSSWWRPWKKEEKFPEVSQVSQVIELPQPEAITSVPSTEQLGADCVTPISLDEGRLREPNILVVPARRGDEMHAPGSVPSPSNSDAQACGIPVVRTAGSVVRHFSLDPDGMSRHEQSPSEATPTIVSAFDG
mmetsp:Transcript_59804/g.139857  ORF Transcript_59804/g.139857 Transcript_59804/m.139857 type:complete len:189 (+) Transcript_59804:117-683(+)